MSPGARSAGAVAHAEERRLAWAYLSRVVQGPCAALSALIDLVGVLEAARAVREWDLPEALRRRTEARHAIDTAAADLESIARLGGRLVTPDDPDWPAWRLMAFARLDPVGEGDEGEPLALWARGEGALTDFTERAIGVVGARAMSSYGGHVTAEVVGELVRQGWTIVSGAAYGVDGAAHRSALAAGGQTVAVLAAGLDRPYPAGHARLLREIADTGLVISEYPPGTLPAKHRFLVRNRLVAALSDAVLVVEAGARSGARNTAAWARKLGRPALAVPGSVLSAMSVGCHAMVRDGEALLVTDAAQVIAEAGPLRLPPPSAGAARPTDGLQGDELRVYDAFPAAGARTPRELAESSGVALADVRAVLPVLELAGHITSDDAGWRRCSR
jgi:DNA processing protein